MSNKKPNLDSLFEAAVGIESAEERAEFVVEACGDDVELRAQLEQLLASDEVAGSFLEQPAPELQVTQAPASGQRAAALEAGLAAAFDENQSLVMGSQGHSVLKTLENTIQVPNVALRESRAEGDDPINRPDSPEIPQQDSDSRYQLQGEIARGGMGAVLKGRDTDLGRDLAIKVLLDAHKNNPDVVQRFVEEAQIGGQLQHPGIAPIYELGQFADQRPFFAMKLVKGETLAKLLADREDPVADRSKFLGIFEQVCQTMAYAHSRGVIHRDLKPANIMVGAFGEVQVMDWGLAKVLSTGGVADEKKAQRQHVDVSVIQTRRSTGSDAPGSAGSAGSDTQMGSVMGTPAYMPPEQALGEIDQLDQRADVFSLGAILCEILTGRPPYVGEDGTQVFRLASRGKLDDAFSRLDDCGADAELVTLAKECLAVEPADRPQDASVLAQRLTTYLESVEQKLRETELAKVDAQVRAEELRRRQRLALTTGTAIVATLLVGISVSLWQMVRANNAEELATEEAKRATAAQVVAKDEAEKATLAEKKTAESLIAVAAERDAKELARKDAADISTFLTDILQSPDPARDGHEIKVAELLDRAAKKLETDLVDQPGERAKLQSTLAKTYHALSLYREAIPLQLQVRDYHLATSGLKDMHTVIAKANLAKYYRSVGQYEKAVKLGEELLSFCRKAYGPEDRATVIAMSGLGVSYRLAGQFGKASKLSEQTLELHRKLDGPEHSETLGAMHNVAAAYFDTGLRDKALKMQEELLTLSRQINGSKHLTTLLRMNNLANFYNAAGQWDKSLKLYKEALKGSREAYGPEHAKTLMVLGNLARGLNDAGHWNEALILNEESLALRRKVLGPEHPDAIGSMTSLAISYDNAGRFDEALKLREEELRLCRKVLAPEHPDTINTMNNLANSYALANRPDQALKLAKEVLALSRKVLGLEHPDTLVSMMNVSLSCSDDIEALKMQEELLPLYHKVFSAEHLETVKLMFNLAVSYDAVDRNDEALKLREELVELCPRVLGPKHPYTFQSMSHLAFSYDAVDRDDEALKLREELLALSRKELGPEHSRTLKAMSDLAGSYAEAERKDEALKLQEELTPLSRKVHGPEDPRTLGEMTNLACHYANVGRLSEAVALQEKTLALKRQAIPDHRYLPIAINSMSVLYLRTGRPEKALPLISELLEYCDDKRGNTSRALNVAALQVWFAVDDEYQVTRKRMLAWAADTDDRAAADQVTRLSCLQPIEDAETQKAALDLGQKAVTLGQDHKEFLPWSHLSLGMAEYRNGQFDKAAKTLTTATESATDTDDEDHVARITGTANFYRAMCLFQQGKKDEARALFTATAAKMKPLPADEKNPHTDDEADHDDLVLWLAFKEAKAMIGVKETPPEDAPRKNER